MRFFQHSTQNKYNGHRLIGIILILMGLIVLGVPLLLEVKTEAIKILWVGGIPILLGIILMSIFSGTIIDFEAKKIKKYHTMLWFKFGKWENLPKLENTELIHYTYRHRNTPNGISPTISAEVTTYKCVLTLEDREFMVFDYAKEQDAIDALDIIRKSFKLSGPIQDKNQIMSLEKKIC